MSSQDSRHIFYWLQSFYFGGTLTNVHPFIRRENVLGHGPSISVIHVNRFTHFKKVKLMF